MFWFYFPPSWSRMNIMRSSCVSLKRVSLSELLQLCPWCLPKNRTVSTLMCLLFFFSQSAHLTTVNIQVMWLIGKRTSILIDKGALFVLSRSVLIWRSGMSIISERIKLGHCVWSSHFVLLTLLLHCFDMWMSLYILIYLLFKPTFSWPSLCLFLQWKMTHLLLVSHCFITDFHYYKLIKMK